MKNLNGGSKARPDQLAETGSPYGLQFPINPGFSSRPPGGTWEDGYRLSVLALREVKDRPEIFEERNRRMCMVEFVL